MPSKKRFNVIKYLLIVILVFSIIIFTGSLMIYGFFFKFVKQTHHPLDKQAQEQLYNKTVEFIEEVYTQNYREMYNDYYLSHVYKQEVSVEEWKELVESLQRQVKLIKILPQKKEVTSSPVSLLTNRQRYEFEIRVKLESLIYAPQGKVVTKTCLIRWIKENGEFKILSMEIPSFNATLVSGPLGERN